MLIKKIKQVFINELTNYYSANEAEAIFYLVLKYLTDKTRTDELLDHTIDDVQIFYTILTELKTGIPIQYCLGFAFFLDLKLKVTSHTLIPRPETEELVHWVCEENKNFSGRLLDVGTGSGCIALGLKSKLRDAQITGLDVSVLALEVAQENATNLGLEVSFIHLDILESFPADEYDLIVSNPPYIGLSEKDTLQKNVIDFEPHLALFAPSDVLAFYKRLAMLSRLWHCTTYAEISEFYVQDLTFWLSENLFIFEFKRDLNGKFRFVKICSKK